MILLSQARLFSSSKLVFKINLLSSNLYSINKLAFLVIYFFSDRPLHLHTPTEQIRRGNKLKRRKAYYNRQRKDISVSLKEKNLHKKACKKQSIHVSSFVLFLRGPYLWQALVHNPLHLHHTTNTTTN